MEEKTKQPVTLGQGIEFLNQLLRECERKNISREELQQALENPEIRERVFARAIHELLKSGGAEKPAKIKPKASLARKSLGRELKRQSQKELTGRLERQTQGEIQEELTVVKTCQKAKDAWEEFCNSGNVPELARFTYDSIFDMGHSKEEYEPDDELKKEMVALCLTDRLCNPILERDAYQCRWKIDAGHYVRSVISHQKGHTTWDGANYVLEPIRLIVPQRVKVVQVIDRLAERLSELPDDGIDSEIQRTLLEPLGTILNTELYPSVLGNAVIDLIGGNWYPELNRVTDLAVRKLEGILECLPDPKKVSCVEAVRRVVEIFESEPEKPGTSVQTLEDATILEHVEKCSYAHCRILQRCTTTALDYAIVREWSDRSAEYVEEAIRKAKEYLAETSLT